MNRAQIIVTAVLAFFIFPLNASTPSVEGIDLQEDDQASCVSKFVASCVAKCDQTIDSNCQSLCEETAKNECKYAGE